MNNDIAAALLPVIGAFESLDIVYCIGGSLASSAFGIPRSTLDADLVADLVPAHVARIVQMLQPTYYIDADAIHDAIRGTSSFNLIHLDTMVKIDVFVPKDRSFDRSALTRRIEDSAAFDPTTVFFSSPLWDRTPQNPQSGA